MRCHICDAIIKHPVKNEQTGEYEPCPVCVEKSKEEVDFFGLTYTDLTDSDIGDLILEEEKTTASPSAEVSPVE